ncbi:peptidylprolyl isomerase [Rubellicoccus peritrichatus]|uniref:Peptidylprolyl isomerase n=1 Tax=Rubellicoccus peritrichatus TaxID=3080537 RepID=A0AAQ3QUM1_9BACT|nr:peptidylprolyl isomerase [Puniceicoccus sp. CR14]WOO40080.1 peptidylprolyl isomerase [Puniceicoccus sp. CR14]
MKNYYSLMGAAVVGICMCFSGCSEKPTIGSDMLAQVNDHSITEDHMKYTWQQQLPPKDTPEARRKVLDQLIRRSALADYAIAAGLDKDPMVIATFEGILASRLQEVELFPQIEAVKVTEAEALEHYQENQQAYMQPEGFSVAVLWFASRGVEPLEARYHKRLERLREDIIQQPSPVDQGFGKLSQMNTEHAASRYRGGVIPILQPTREHNQWRLAVLEIAKELSHPGQLSDVVVNEEGVFLVRLLEKREASPRSFDSVRSSITKQLKRDRVEVIKENFELTVVTAADIKRFDDRLQSLLLETPLGTMRSTDAFYIGQN